MILDRFGAQVPSVAETFNHLRTGNSDFSQFLTVGDATRSLPSPLDFERLTNEFYRCNAVVYAAIRALSRSASEPVFQACTIDRKGVAQVDDPLRDPLAMLIANPNDEQEAYEFFEKLIVHLQVAGNAFIRKIRSRQKNVVQLKLLRPDLIRFENTRSRVPVVKFGEVGKEETILCSDIIHLRLPDAFDETWGLSPLYVLASFGDIDQQSTEFLRSYFLNRGVPSGMLVAKGRVQDPDREKMKDSWQEQFSGPDGWHKIPVMDSGVEYQALSTGLRDLDLNPVFNQTETRIAMVFGVPPILLGTAAGLERSTFSNFAESRRGFWTETLVPMYTRIVRRLTKMLAQQEFGPRRQIKADVSRVAGLQENKEKLRTLAQRGFDKGLFTVNEARDILDMPPLDNLEVGDAIKLSTASILVPRDQAVQFADLVGDVITDSVQEEIVETEEGKVIGVGDPNPSVGKPDRKNPAEQTLRRAVKLEEEAKKLRRQARKESNAAQLSLEQFDVEDPMELIEGLAGGELDAIDFMSNQFADEDPEDVAVFLTLVIDSINSEDLRLHLFGLFIDTSMDVCMALFQLALALEIQGKTSDEIEPALFNALHRLKKEDENDVLSGDPEPIDGSAG